MKLELVQHVFFMTVSLTPADMNSVQLIEESPPEAPRHQLIYRDSSLSSGFVGVIKAGLDGLELLLLSLSRWSEFVNDPLKGKHSRLFFFFNDLLQNN